MGQQESRDGEGEEDGHLHFAEGTGTVGHNSANLGTPPPSGKTGKRMEKLLRRAHALDPRRSKHNYGRQESDSSQPSYSSTPRSSPLVSRPPTTSGGQYTSHNVHDELQNSKLVLDSSLDSSVDEEDVATCKESKKYGHTSSSTSKYKTHENLKSDDSQEMKVVCLDDIQLRETSVDDVDENVDDSFMMSVGSSYLNRVQNRLQKTLAQNKDVYTNESKTEIGIKNNGEDDLR